MITTLASCIGQYTQTHILFLKLDAHCHLFHHVSQRKARPPEAQEDWGTSIVC